MPPASSCTQTVGRYFPPQSSDGVISLDCGQTPYSDFLLVRAICQTPLPRLAGHTTALQPARASSLSGYPGGLPPNL